MLVSIPGDVEHFWVAGTLVPPRLTNRAFYSKRCACVRIRRPKSTYNPITTRRLITKMFQRLDLTSEGHSVKTSLASLHK